MNYSEIAAAAMRGEKWAGKYKAVKDERNAAILAARQVLLDKHTGIKQGDFAVINGKLTRVCHVWNDSVQLTDGEFSGSFYLGEGFADYSGGLNPGVDKTRFRLTGERREGNVWFFSENMHMAHNGYRCKAFFPVWEVV